MVPPTCACSTAEQEDQTTHAPCKYLVSLQRPLQGDSGDESYDRPDAAQPLAAPPHTSDTELGSSTSPAALVNTGERHSGDAPPQLDIHDIPPGWSGDHPDRELNFESYSDLLEWLEQLEQTPDPRTLGFSAENEEVGSTNPHAVTEGISMCRSALVTREMQETPDEAALYLDNPDALKPSAGNPTREAAAVQRLAAPVEPATTSSLPPWWTIQSSDEDDGLDDDPVFSKDAAPAGSDTELGSSTPPAALVFAFCVKGEQDRQDVRSTPYPTPLPLQKTVNRGFLENEPPLAFMFTNEDCSTHGAPVVPTATFILANGDHPRGFHS